MGVRVGDGVYFVGITPASVSHCRVHPPPSALSGKGFTDDTDFTD